MNKQELTTFLGGNENIEWFDDIENEQLCFRNTYVDWYRNDGNRKSLLFMVSKILSLSMLQFINFLPKLST